MNNSKIFTITLTDLGEYTATVAAYDEREAALIAKAMLFEEATQLPLGLTIVKRDCETVAKPADVQPTSVFDVRATYMLDFSIKVPAESRGQAEAHARRLYEANMGPFDFDHDGGRVSDFRAREVVS